MKAKTLPERPRSPIASEGHQPESPTLDDDAEPEGAFGTLGGRGLSGITLIEGGGPYGAAEENTVIAGTS